MSHAFINPEQQKQQSNQNNQTQQRKSDPKAELEYINSPEPDTSWNIADVDPVIANHVAQRFAKEEEKDKQIQQKSKEEELQAKQENNQQDVLQKKGSTGAKTNLPGDVQAKMENSFNTDFSSVNIHKDSSQATNMGALAYTQGNDVHFAPGQFKPESQKGQELIGHELTHVVQQRQGRVKPEKQGKGMAINSNPSLEKEADVAGAKAAQGKSTEVAGKGSGVQKKENTIQMLKKDNFPWTGIVKNATLLALRNNPNGDVLADMPDGTLVTVKGINGGWLEIEVDTTQTGIILNNESKKKLSGDILKGYAGHSFIDDAVSSEMDEMLGEEAKWKPSGPTSGNSFQIWASATTESAAPTLQSITTINCWEMVLLAAYRSGAVSWKWIHDLYTNSTGNWYDELPNRMTSSGTVAYDQTTKKPEPDRGMLVFFDGASHVSLATGNSDEIFTFWPPPNTAFTAGGTVDDVKLSTIEELSVWMENNFGSKPNVTIGTPAW